MRVLLVDGNPKVRWALRTFIQEETEFAVVGEASDADTLFSQAQRLQPDLILLDGELGGIAAGKLLPSLFAISPTVRVIILSSRPESQQDALDAGAASVASKASGPEQLLAILRRVAQGEDQSDHMDSETKRRPGGEDGI